MNQLLQVDARMPIGADQNVGADAHASRKVPARVADLDVGRIVASAPSQLIAGALDKQCLDGLFGCLPCCAWSLLVGCLRATQKDDCQSKESEPSHSSILTRRASSGRSFRNPHPLPIRPAHSLRRDFRFAAAAPSSFFAFAKKARGRACGCAGRSELVIILRLSYELIGVRRRKRTTMAKKAEAREIIRVVCTVDGTNFYTTTKNKRNTTERLEIMKYNPRLRKHTLHREKK